MSRAKKMFRYFTKKSAQAITRVGESVGARFKEFKRQGDGGFGARKRDIPLQTQSLQTESH